MLKKDFLNKNSIVFKLDLILMKECLHAGMCDT